MFEAGAPEVWPGIYGVPSVLRSIDDVRLIDEAPLERVAKTASQRTSSPQHTIMALSRLASTRLADRACLRSRPGIHRFSGISPL